MYYIFFGASGDCSDEIHKKIRESMYEDYDMTRVANNNALFTLPNGNFSFTGECVSILLIADILLLLFMMHINTIWSEEVIASFRKKHRLHNFELL